MKVYDDVNELRRTLLAALPLLALADSVQAQDAAKVQPRAYRVVLENDVEAGGDVRFLDQAAPHVR